MPSTSAAAFAASPRWPSSELRARRRLRRSEPASPAIAPIPCAGGLRDALFAGAFLAVAITTTSVDQARRRMLPLAHRRDRDDDRIAVELRVRLAGSSASGPSAGLNTMDVASVSAATIDWCAASRVRSDSGTPSVSTMRSDTSRPASRRACCTRRTRSRAVPSASSSGVTSMSSTTTPAPTAERGARPVAGDDEPQRVLPACSAMPPATTSSPILRPVARLDRLDHLLRSARRGAARAPPARPAARTWRRTRRRR